VSSQRRKRQRLRPLAFEILPSLGRKCASSGGSTVVVRSTGEEDLDHWFLCPGEAQEKPTEGRDRESLDLIQKSRQPSDRTGGAWGLTLLTPGRSPDSHRDIDVQVKSGVSRGQENRGFGPFVSGDTWWQIEFRRSGYRHSHG
jgi:hypothetical protein